MSVASVKAILIKLLKLSSPISSAKIENLATELSYINKVVNNERINQYQLYDDQIKIKKYSRKRQKVLRRELFKRNAAELKFFNQLNQVKK